MEFHEYPKALYRNGEYTAVPAFEAEQEHREEGWTDWHGDQARMAAPAPVVLTLTDTGRDDTPPAAPEPEVPAEAMASAAPARSKGGRPRKVA